MLKTVEAVIDEQGNVKILQPIPLQGTRCALVVILDELALSVAETALLSEAALAEDWNKPEEDEAWSYLKRATS
jgi:predicted DNA-binding antitoxin AbrB/MazE fold protein